MKDSLYVNEGGRGSAEIRRIATTQLRKRGNLLNSNRIEKITKKEDAASSPDLLKRRKASRAFTATKKGIIDKTANRGNKQEKRLKKGNTNACGREREEM